jgi:hypothetical protein
MDANARRQIEYAKKRLRRKYRGPDLTSGPLTVGKCYQLTRFGIGDDFTNVGASGISLDHAGEIFKATGTTPAVWSHGSVLNEIAIADLTRDADTVFEAATQTVTIRSGAFVSRPPKRGTPNIARCAPFEACCLEILWRLELGVWNFSPSRSRDCVVIRRRAL